LYAGELPLLGRDRLEWKINLEFPWDSAIAPDSQGTDIQPVLNQKPHPLNPVAISVDFRPSFDLTFA
jgi:hypothetical protein